MRVLGQVIRNLLEPVGFGGSRTIDWLLLDQFLTDRAAGTINGTPAEPNGGTRTVTDSGNHISISGDQLVFDGNQVGTGDPRISWEAEARLLGKAFIFRVTFATTTTWAYTGLDVDAVGNPSAAYLYWRASGEVRVFDGNQFNLPDTYGAQKYDLVFIQRAAGTLAIVRAASGAFRLWWPGTNLTSNPVYPMVGKATVNAGAFTVQRVGVTQLTAPYSLEYGLATVEDSSLSSGDSFVGDADGFFDFYFTLPGSPNALDEIVLEYRRTDANNKWKAYLQRNAGNTAWDFRLDSVSGGVATNRIAVTGVASPTAIRVRAYGQLHDCWTLASGQWTKRGGQINISHQNTVTGMAITAVAGTTLTRVVGYPLTSDLYESLGDFFT